MTYHKIDFYVNTIYLQLMFNRKLKLRTTVQRRIRNSTLETSINEENRPCKYIVLCIKNTHEYYITCLFLVCRQNRLRYPYFFFTQNVVTVVNIIFFFFFTGCVKFKLRFGVMLVITVFQILCYKLWSLKVYTN